jgi:hypothetical protein
MRLFLEEWMKRTFTLSALMIAEFAGIWKVEGRLASMAYPSMRIDEGILMRLRSSYCPSNLRKKNDVPLPCVIHRNETSLLLTYINRPLMSDIASTVPNS